MPELEIDRLLTLVRTRYPDWKDFDHPGFRQDEIGYKRAAADKASQLLRKDEFKKLLDSGDFDELTRRVITVASATNLLFLGVPSQGDLAVLYQEALDKSTFFPAFYDLLHGAVDGLSRLDRFLDYVRRNELVNKWTFPTYYLFLLQPDKEMFVKPTAMTAVMTLLGFEESYVGEPSVAKYELLRDAMHELRERLSDLGARDLIDVQSLLWVAYDADRGTVQYWKVAPGERAWQWDECCEEGFIGVGWGDLGDISGLSRKDFDERLAEARETRTDWKKAGPNQVWTFSRIKEGDRIVANRGTSEVVGIGTVIGPYYYQEGVRYRHRFPVDWDDPTRRRIDEPGWRRTVLKLDRQKFEAVQSAPRILTKGQPGGDLPALPAEVLEDGTDPQVLNPPFSLRELAAESGFPERELERWVRAVERKGQAILFGPPGTGKTYVAQRLAHHLIGGNDGFSELVQFHPAYSYEDFLQGLRPRRTADGALTYDMTKGRFLDFCDRARKLSPDGRAVLIIDEINRANLARVFGELMYLLEYRDQQIPLAGGGPFRIPSNVRIVGTMNTADRSIALVDHALRRRFAFLRLEPQYEVLRRFHDTHGTGFEPDGLIAVLRRLNHEIHDANYFVGITFFLLEDLADEVEDVWQMEVQPYVEEFFFDRPQRAKAFRWEAVSREVLGEE